LLQDNRAHVYLTYPFVLSWSLLETMSAGGAILASDTAPVREVIFDDETGSITDVFDTDTLADNLDRLLDDAKLRSWLGVAARQLVLDRFNLEKICLPQQL
jgi:glycosyltransferase involved in cell wall biosynthesis